MSFKICSSPFTWCVPAEHSRTLSSATSVTLPPISIQLLTVSTAFSYRILFNLRSEPARSPRVSPQSPTRLRLVSHHPPPISVQLLQFLRSGIDLSICSIQTDLRLSGRARTGFPALGLSPASQYVSSRLLSSPGLAKKPFATSRHARLHMHRSDLDLRVTGPHRTRQLCPSQRCVQFESGSAKEVCHSSPGRLAKIHWGAIARARS